MYHLILFLLLSSCQTSQLLAIVIGQNFKPHSQYQHYLWWHDNIIDILGVFPLNLDMQSKFTAEMRYFYVQLLKTLKLEEQPPESSLRESFWNTQGFLGETCVGVSFLYISSGKLTAVCHGFMVRPANTFLIES